MGRSVGSSGRRARQQSWADLLRPAACRLGASARSGRCPAQRRWCLFDRSGAPKVGAGGARSVAVRRDRVPVAHRRVVRDYIGDRENRFFASVFLGSGLLFLALLAAAALAAGLVATGGKDSALLADGVWGSVEMRRTRCIDEAMHLAAVFMVSTSTILSRGRYRAPMAHGLRLRDRRGAADRRGHGPLGRSALHRVGHARQPAHLPRRLPAVRARVSRVRRPRRALESGSRGAAGIRAGPRLLLL